MAYTVTKRTTYGSRVGKAFSGMIAGVLMFIGGTVMLWWNEGNFVAVRDALNEAQEVTVKVNDISRVDSSLNGQLIHAQGLADTQEVLKDPIFQIGERAIAIKREVEYYQWTEQSTEETHTNLGGEEETVITYTYSQRWVSEPVNSSSFADPDARRYHVNTVAATVPDSTIWAKNVSFGAYTLPEFLIHSINRFEPMQANLEPEVYDSLKRQLRGTSNSNSRPYSADRWEESSADITTSGNTVYIGRSPASPSIGDVRITFSKVLPAEVSILAQVSGSTFERYNASNGETVSRLDYGRLSMENMYGEAHSENSMMTWLLRGLGALLIIAGLKALVAPLAVIASVIPMLGTIANAGTGLVCGLLGLGWSLLIISIAWLWYRPLIGIVMLIIAGGLIALLYVKGKARKAAAAAAPTPPSEPAA